MRTVNIRVHYDPRDDMYYLHVYDDEGKVPASIEWVSRDPSCINPPTFSMSPVEMNTFLTSNKDIIVPAQEKSQRTVDKLKKLVYSLTETIQKQALLISGLVAPDETI